MIIPSAPSGIRGSCERLTVFAGEQLIHGHAALNLIDNAAIRGVTAEMQFAAAFHDALSCAIIRRDDRVIIALPQPGLLAGRLDLVATPASIAAIVTVSAFVSRSRPIVMRRAIVLADGIRCRFCVSTFSARRLRVAHSLTTRSEPGKPRAVKRRQSSAPLRQPDAH